jgi:hypothetical protein
MKTADKWKESFAKWRGFFSKSNEDIDHKASSERENDMGKMVKNREARVS